MKNYRCIPGYGDSYEASEDGYVHSNLRNKVLKFRFDQSGYRRVSLLGKDHSIHRLVALCFLDTFQEHLEVNHIDGDKLNNHVNNLEMVTHKQNMEHASRIGLFKNTHKGEASHLAKLSKNDVLEIRRLWALRTMYQKDIAALFNCNLKNISEIVRRNSWRHV